MYEDRSKIIQDAYFWGTIFSAFQYSDPGGGAV